MPDNIQDIPLEELKSIVHGLKMSTLSFVEDGAAEEIKAFIKALPSPEQIDEIAAIPMNIKRLQSDIGNIMRFIELYGKRDIEFKTRYKSRTGLPPRYKVLDWKKEASMNKITIKNGLIRNLISLSEKIDSENPVVSKKIIECARQVQNDKISLSALNLITQELMGDNRQLTKEAQAFTDINLDFSGITGGLQNIRQNLNNIMQFINNKMAYLNKHPKTQKYTDLLKNIWYQVNKLSEFTNEQSSGIKESTKSIENSMSKDVVPKGVWFNDKQIKIQWEDDPTDEGYQRAVVYEGGKKYEVQEDEKGNRSLKEILMPEKNTEEVLPEVKNPIFDDKPISEIGQLKHKNEQEKKSQFLVGQKVYYIDKNGVNSLYVIDKVSDDGKAKITKLENGKRQPLSIIVPVRELNKKTSLPLATKAFNLKKHIILGKK